MANRMADGAEREDKDERGEESPPLAFIHDVLTLDTQVFAHESYDLNGPWLSLLTTFKGGPTQIVISQVVAAEVRGHLATEIQKTRISLEAAAKKAVMYGLRTGGEAGLAPVEIDAWSVAETQLNAYFKAIGAEIVSADLITVGELLNRYFSAAPPFAVSGKKKAEFPDAIALLSLEVWAERNNRRILAISNDGDWKAYGDKSARIDVEETLELGLARLQEQAAEAQSVVAEQLEAIASGLNSDLAEDFERHLSSAVAGASVSAEAESYMLVEGEDVELDLSSFAFRRIGTSIPYKLLQASAVAVAASVQLKAVVSASATFNFSVYDSVDKDDVSLGGAQADRDDVEVDLQVLVRFDHDAEAGWTLSEVDLVSITDPIPFGFVEPDWSDQIEATTEPQDYRLTEPDEF